MREKWRAWSAVESEKDRTRESEGKERVPALARKTGGGRDEKGDK